MSTDSSEREAFVAGARWWQFKKDGSTMFPSEVDEAEREAEKRFPFAPWLHLERIKQLEAELQRVLDACTRWERRHHDLEKLALEAPHAPECAKYGYIKSACTCWKSKIGGSK